MYLFKVMNSSTHNNLLKIYKQYYKNISEFNKQSLLKFKDIIDKMLIVLYNSLLNTGTIHKNIKGYLKTKKKINELLKEPRRRR